MVNHEFWCNKRVLLTGHTGFKGSWMSLWLQHMAAELCGVALVPDTDPNLFTLAKVTDGMQSHFVDVADYNKVKSIIHEFKPEIVLHMAAQPLVRYSYQNPIETYRTNVMGTVHVLEAARACASVRAVVNVTSDKCYQNNEWVWGYRENEPMGGHDPYSNSKGCSELVTSAYRDSFYRASGVGLASGRAGNVIGGGDWSQDRLISDIMRSIVEKKSVVIRHPDAIRPWQHVLEPLSGYLMLAEALYRDPKYAQAWNFGPQIGDAVKVRRIVEQLFALWPSEHAGWEVDQSNDHPHEAHFLKLDISKAVAELGWGAQLDVHTALQWVVDWYRAWLDNRDMKQFTLAQIATYENLMRSKHD